MEIITEFNKRFNIIVLILLITALAVCYYTLNNVAEYQQRCNDHWQHEIKTKCRCSTIDLYNDNQSLFKPIDLSAT